MDTSTGTYLILSTIKINVNGAIDADILHNFQNCHNEFNYYILPQLIIFSTEKANSVLAFLGTSERGHQLHLLGVLPHGCVRSDHTSVL